MLKAAQSHSATPVGCDPAPAPLRIAIADDHPVTRFATRAYLDGFPDLRLVAEAETGRQAIEIVRAHRIDVLLLDLVMPQQSGIDAIPLIRARAPATAVLVFSALSDVQYAVPLIREGIAGYLNKGCEPVDLVRAIRHVARGGRWVSAEVGDLLATRALEQAAQRPHEQLSSRELQIFLKLARGMSTGEIAHELSLSTRTISSYRARIATRLQASTCGELTYYALQHGLID